MSKSNQIVVTGEKVQAVGIGWNEDGQTCRFYRLPNLDFCIPISELTRKIESGEILVLKPETITTAESLRDKLDRVLALSSALISEVCKMHPTILIPDQEGLYLAIHNLKQELKGGPK